MDFVTITDHDTIDGALELADRPGRLHLRGADGLVPRRAAGRARPLLRHHARRPRVAAGPRRRRRGVRRVPARERDHVRAGAPVLRGRGAADAAPPAPARRAVPDLGDAQRLARPGAQRARRGLHRDARRHRRRRHRRPRGRRHRPHVHRDAARGDAGEFLAPHPRRAAPSARRAGQRREVGARRDGAGDSRALEPRRRRTAAPPDPTPVLEMVERVMREGDARAARSAGTSGPRTPAPCSRVAGRRRPRPDAARAARAACRPTTSATPSSSAARAARTSASCARRWRPRVEARRRRGG